MLIRFGGPVCAIPKSCWSVNPLPRYSHFSIFIYGGRTPSWFSKFKSLTACKVQRIKTSYPAKHRAIRTIRWKDMAIFWFFKMAAVRHLGFLKDGFVFNCLWGSKAKFRANPTIRCVIDNVDVLIFCVFGLKAPIFTPKTVFGGFQPPKC